MFRKQSTALALAGALTALAPTFAQASDRDTCNAIANARGIHQYDTSRGIMGYQEGQGTGCEYKAIGGQFRVTGVYNLQNEGQSRRFYNNWSRAEQQQQREQSRDPLGLRETNQGINDVRRTVNGVTGLIRSLDRLTR